MHNQRKSDHKSTERNVQMRKTYRTAFMRVDVVETLVIAFTSLRIWVKAIRFSGARHTIASFKINGEISQNYNRTSG